MKAIRLKKDTLYWPVWLYIFKAIHGRYATTDKVLTETIPHFIVHPN